MARRHDTTKPSPPHARLHREHNAAATHGTRKKVCEISMLHPRKEQNGDKTHITRDDKEGKEQGARSKYVTVSCHAAHTREATSARPAPYTLRQSVVSRLCFASSHTLLTLKIKRIRTLRLWKKNKIDQSLSPSQVCCMSRRARGTDNEQRWRPKRCVEPCREQVGYKPTPNNAR